MFGLLALVLTVALGVWMVVGNTKTSPDGANESTYNNYFDAIDSAEEVAGLIGDSSSNRARGVTVYDGITIPADARTLDLSGRGLTGSLKAEVRQLGELRTLDISRNNFTGLPAEVGQLSKLEVLNLSDNPLTGLPYELGNLQNLKTLDLRGTNYAEADLVVIQSKLPATVRILVD